MSDAHAEEEEAVLDKEDGKVVRDVPLGLTHRCLATNRKGSRCLGGMKRAPHLEV